MKQILYSLLLTAAAISIPTMRVTARDGAAQKRDAEAMVIQLEAAFRVAKLKNDTAALDHILAAAFYETNQNGNGRDKSQFIELFKGFKIMSLTTDDAQVRVTGNTAVVTGSETEVNSNGTDRLLFTRVYVRDRDGWRLLASTQFRNPKA